MFSAIFVMVLATRTIVACGSSGSYGQENNGKIAICHGQHKNPYGWITDKVKGLNNHGDHS